MLMMRLNHLAKNSMADMQLINKNRKNENKYKMHIMKRIKIKDKSNHRVALTEHQKTEESNLGALILDGKLSILAF